MPGEVGGGEGMQPEREDSLTVCHAMEPVVATVDPKEGHPPGEGGVPG